VVEKAWGGGGLLAWTSHQKVSRPSYGLRREALVRYLLRASLEQGALARGRNLEAKRFASKCMDHQPLKAGEKCRLRMGHMASQCFRVTIACPHGRVDDGSL
jgi:hypothetical protein